MFFSSQRRSTVRSHSQENAMYAVPIQLSQPVRWQPSALTIAFVLSMQLLAQAHAGYPQGHPWQTETKSAQARAAADGQDRSIIFVGGRKQHDNADREITAHPPNPCTSTRTETGDDCNLNPQPIPPGRSLHRTRHSPAPSTSAQDKSVLETPTVPRRHRPAVPNHGGN